MDAKVAENNDKIAENKPVSTAIEIEIRKLHAESGDPALVADQLFKRWNANVLTDDDVRAVAKFMVNAGLYRPLIAQLRKCLKKDLPLPWAGFAETILRLKVPLAPIESDAIFEGVASQTEAFQVDMMYDLVESRGFDEFDPRPAVYRVQKTAHIRRVHEEKRADLQRQLDYARANRLLSQERRILDLIQAFDPSDPLLAREKVLFAYREAQEIVQNALSHSPPKSEIERKFSQLSPDIQKAAQPIVEHIHKIATTAEEPMVYDLALMLVFMELHDEGIRLLESHRMSPRIDWLLLETLILGRQYAAVLGEVESLELKYAGDSETPFVLTYARARALWGLGDTVTAIELMKSLARVRPTYRSASNLLQQWTEEAP